MNTVINTSPDDLNGNIYRISDCDIKSYIRTLLAVIAGCAASSCISANKKQEASLLQNVLQCISESDIEALAKNGNYTTILLEIENIMTERMQQLSSETDISGLAQIINFSHEDILVCADQICTYCSIMNCIHALKYLEKELMALSERFAHAMGMGRVCLQDFLPRSLGAYFFQQAQQISSLRARLACESLWWKSSLLGQASAFSSLRGNPDHIDSALQGVSHQTGIALVRASAEDVSILPQRILEIHSAIYTTAIIVGRFSRDLILLSSGPKCGFNDISLPAVQPGSSIMPGKVNPVMPDMMVHIGMKIAANHNGISLSLFGRELETPCVGHTVRKLLFETLSIFPKALQLFTQKTLPGIQNKRTLTEPDLKRSRKTLHVLASLAFGKKKADEFMKKDNDNLDGVIQTLSLFSKDIGMKDIFDPQNMTRFSFLTQLRAGVNHENRTN